MIDSIWIRGKLREEKSAGMNPYRGARYFADSFSVVPSTVTRSQKEIAELAEKEFGPPVNPRKSRNRQA